jgi:preprotein translocase subunit SecA
MTGTAKSSSPELKEFYGLDVAVILTHKPCIRKDHPDMVFAAMADKQKAIVDEIKRVHSAGQPI